MLVSCGPHSLAQLSQSEVAVLNCRPWITDKVIVCMYHALQVSMVKSWRCMVKSWRLKDLAPQRSLVSGHSAAAIFRFLNLFAISSLSTPSSWSIRDCWIGPSALESNPRSYVLSKRRVFDELSLPITVRYPVRSGVDVRCWKLGPCGRHILGEPPFPAPVQLNHPSDTQLDITYAGSGHWVTF